jgi:eukaryotic-like serine/threonine-protein kinase
MSSTGLLAPGTVVGGRYRIEEPLAGEGSSAVYRAADSRLERHVALRALPAADGGAGQQGRAAARLVHPNVARVLDFGTDSELGLEFVVADLGTGGSLAALLTQRGTPPLPLGLRMIQEAAAGLAAAHRAGLVHGDLHPGVLWLSRDEGRLRVQVLGLGLNPASAPPPRATARYASPERLRKSRELAPVADVFSLGVIAYEVFAGLPADWSQLLIGMARGQAVVAPSLLEQRPELPAHVAQAVRRALAADPASRWPDAGEMAAHLISDLAAQLSAEPETDAAVSIPAAEVAAPIAVAAGVAVPIAAAAVVAAATPVDVPAPVQVESAAEASAAAEAETVDAPAAKPGRQPLVAGRRGKPALASTDLADTLYIPPSIAKARGQSPAPDAPAAAPASKPVEPIAAVPVLARIAEPAAAPAAAESTALVAIPGEATAVAVPERRRTRGIAQLGQPSPTRRVLLAASIVVAVVVAGGVAVKMGIAGGTSAKAPAVQPLASRALASAGGATGVAQPQAPAGDSALPAPLAEAPKDETLTPEEQRRKDEEAKRLEDQRRQQQRQRDSLRQVQVAAAQAAGRPIPPAPQQVALQAPSRPVPDLPAAQPEQRVEAPAPSAAPPAAAAPAEPAARPSADRIYGAEEVDRPPSLANSGAFRASVQRTYPSSLRGTRQPGNAVVSFVVLADGRVDRSSISVSEASQPAFRAAAAEAIAAARFNPARAGGRAVRSQVSLRLAWHPDQ